MADCSLSTKCEPPNVVSIYVLIDPRTGLIRYVGKARNPKKRFREHLRRSQNRNVQRTKCSCWLRSLAFDGHCPKLEIIDNVPASEWEFWECEYIRLFKALMIPLTNQTGGGEGGDTSAFRKPMPEEQRQKLRLFHAGKQYSLGRIVSSETIEKIKAARAGFRMSESAKAILRQKALGRKHTAEVKLKMSKSHLGKEHPYSKRKNYPGNPKALLNWIKNPLNKQLIHNAAVLRERRKREKRQANGSMHTFQFAS